MNKPLYSTRSQYRKGVSLLSAVSIVLLAIAPLVEMDAQSQPSVRFYPPADLVVLNAKVWTVDAGRPRAEALAIVGDRIAMVGPTTEVKSWIGSDTLKLDAQGKTVLPGFIDAHVHFSSGGAEIRGVQLRDAATPQEFARRIAEHAHTLPKGEWITGGLWDHELWGGEPPRRDWIDDTTRDNPVFVSRYDGHMGLANSLALKLAGVTEETPSPAGGTIVKDARGNPTGLLKDAAMGLVGNIIPARNEEQRARDVRAALAEARKVGLTSIDDISSSEDVRVYQKLAAQHELTLRIYCLTPIQQWQAPAGAGILPGFGSPWVRLGGLKGFADGSLGSTTALFFEPYNDAPETEGLPNAMMLPEGNMLKMALGADRAGLQIAVHAIGDKANRTILDIFQEVVKQNGPRANRRFRIEHAQHIHPDDFAKFARLEVIASMQPYHAIDDGRWAEKRIGHERAKTSYAWRTFLDHHVKVAFGSDWTVAPLHPLLGLYAAVTRATLDGKNPQGWFAEQKITLSEAIYAYTMGSAYAEFSENEKGSLTPGKLADVVLLDADLFALPPEKLKDTKALATIVGGKVVYRRQ